MKKQFKRDVIELSRAWHNYRIQEEFCLSDAAVSAYTAFWSLLEEIAAKYNVSLHALAGCLRIY